MWKPHWLGPTSGPFAECGSTAFLLFKLSLVSLFQAVESILTEVGPFHDPSASWKSGGEEGRREGGIFLPFLFCCQVLIPR